MRPDFTFADVDVDGDDQVGLAEIIYAAIVTRLEQTLGYSNASNMTPHRGLPGTQVTVTGSDFDPLADYSVTVGGVAATVVGITPTAISFNLAPDAVSGPVVISGGQEAFDAGLPFNVLKTVNGRLDLPSSVDPLGYELLHGKHLVAPNPDGTFSLPVPVDTASLVWALRNEDDSVFLGVVTSATGFLVIDAQSTARALAFLSPLLSSRNDARALALMDAMDGTPELAALADFIAAVSDDGIDYQADARFENLLTDLFDTALTAAATAQTSAANRDALAFEPDTPDWIKIKSLNPDYATALPATNVILKQTVTTTSPHNPTQFLVAVDKKQNINPMDWHLEVFKLDPAQFPQGFTSVDDLDHNARFQFIGTRPVASGYLSGSLKMSEWDYVEKMGAAVNTAVHDARGSNAELKANEFELPKKRAAVYLLQGYSGNIWYGTGLSGTRSQADLLESQDQTDKWRDVLAANLAIATIDVLSIISFSDLFDRQVLAGFFQQIIVDVLKAVSIMIDAGETLTTANVIIVVQKTTEAIMKAAITAIAEDGLSAKRLYIGISKTIASALDITGKISAGGQALERVGNLLAPGALAIERALIIPYDPFNPRIDRVSPNQGLEEDRVVIDGANFGFPLAVGQYGDHPNEDLMVSFCQLPPGADPGSGPVDPETYLPVTIESRTGNQILVTVPPDFDSVFTGDGAIYVCMQRQGQWEDKQTNSTHLGPQGQFRILDPPAITELKPATALPGGFLSITGERFGRTAGVVFDDDDEDANDNIVKPASISDTYLLVALPQSPQLEDGPHTVRVRRNLRKSPPTDFTVGFPPGGGPAENPGPLADGWDITVTLADTSNVPDGQISLMEAMLLASQGSLGRDLELHDDCEQIDPGEAGYCGGVQTREVDWIDDFWTSDNQTAWRPGGAGHAERVSVHDSIAGATVIFNGNETPPPIMPDDEFRFKGLLLDGTNAAAGAIGLDFNGAFLARIQDVDLVGWDGGGVGMNSAIYNTLENVHIRSSGGPAIHLNGSQKNQFSGIMIDAVGASGVVLENQAKHNQFTFSTIQNAAGNGIELEGSSDSNMFTFTQMVDIGGRGISLAGESYWNSFTFERIGRVGAAGIYLAGGSSHNDFWGPPLDPANPVANIFDIAFHGLHLRDGANANNFEDLAFETIGGSGIYLEGHATQNDFEDMIVDGAQVHGLHLSGSQVQHNQFASHRAPTLEEMEWENRAAWRLSGVFQNNAGYGILLDNMANNNMIAPQHVHANALGGIRLEGAGTDHNRFGKKYVSTWDFASAYAPELTVVSDNDGHGVRITGGASNNVFELVNSAANQGDGFRVDGPQTAANEFHGIMTGGYFDIFTTLYEPEPAPNGNNGLYIGDGASDNLVGAAAVFRSSIGGDLENGILIEGTTTSGNEICFVDIGSSHTPGQTVELVMNSLFGTRQNGIVIRDNARNNHIGSTHSATRVQIDGASWAGIVLENAHDNDISGVYINTLTAPQGEPVIESRRGIELRQGSSNNRVGRSGPLEGPNPNPAAFLDYIDRSVIINNTTEDGILIRDSGGSLDPGSQRVNANIVVNTVIDSRGVGLHISGRSPVNDIGGPDGGTLGKFLPLDEHYHQQNNDIRADRIGVHLDDLGMMLGDERNRFMHNQISTGLLDADPVPPFDPALDDPDRVGVLISGDCMGVVFGESIKTPNYINQNQFGVFVDGAAHTTIRGNEVGTGWGGANSMASILVRNCTAAVIGGEGLDLANHIGGAGGLLEIPAFGSPYCCRQTPIADDRSAGILLVNVHDSHIACNQVGSNRTAGVVLQDSSRNIVGSQKALLGNVISGNGRDGLVIRGRSQLNLVQNNLIGTDPAGTLQGNEGNGILLTAGASDNHIGGRMQFPQTGVVPVLTPNTIAHNDGEGVKVDGAGTLGNRILSNHIFQNSGLGIYNQNGGNHELPPPANAVYENGAIAGGVADMALVPAGSLVQVFSDTGQEGEVFIGEALVGSDGSWQNQALLPAPYPNLNVTVTHGGLGSTSEFAAVGLARHFRLFRTDLAVTQSEKTIVLTPGEAIPVFWLTAQAEGDSVRIFDILLEAGGSLTDTLIEEVAVYRDNDGDGQLGAADTLIAGPATYDADDGHVSLGFDFTTVDPDRPQNWMVTYRTAQAIAAGATFELVIADSSAVTARYLFPVHEPAPVEPPTPGSDLFTVE